LPDRPEELHSISVESSRMGKVRGWGASEISRADRAFLSNFFDASLGFGCGCLGARVEWALLPQLSALDNPDNPVVAAIVACRVS